MSTFIVLGILIVIVSIVIIKMIKDKKNGKSCCSGDCTHCGGHCSN